MEYLWVLGVRSNKVQVVTEEEIRTARTIRRVPKQQRWTRDNLEWIRCAPWNFYKGVRMLTVGYLRGSLLSKERSLQSRRRKRSI